MTALYVLLVANAVLALLSLVNAVAAVRCARQAQDALRRVARDRHALNLTMQYQHPRSIR